MTCAAEAIRQAKVLKTVFWRSVVFEPEMNQGKIRQ
jgi:hypothetical protein